LLAISRPPARGALQKPHAPYAPYAGVHARAACAATPAVGVALPAAGWVCPQLALQLRRPPADIGSLSRARREEGHAGVADC
jgi:hypothetical protein